MSEDHNDDWQISIFVPESGIVAAPADPAIENHALRDFLPGAGRVAKVSAAAVQDQWDKTVDTLMKLSSTVASRSKEWQIEEIEVGLTLSAKGELLFIAEAGAEASIKFVLKRTPAPTPQPAPAGS